MMYEMTFNITELSNSSHISLLELKRLAFPQWGYTVSGLLLVFIGFFGIVENCLVLYMFYKSKGLRSPTNVFIIGLASSDLCMAIFGNPLAATASLNGKWFAGELFCRWEGFVVFFFGLTALYLLTAVSVDRYVVIARPLQSKMITKRLAVLSVITCYLGGLFWALMPLLGWGVYGLEAPGVFCGLDWETKTGASISYIVAIFLFCYLVPIAIIIVSYYHVYMTVHNIARNNAWQSRSRVARRNLKIERRMMKSVAIMVCVYLLCWTPYAVVSFWQSFGNPEVIPLWLTLVPAIMAKSELIWNPIIYVATNKQFRKAFYATVPCGGIRETLVKQVETQEQSSKETELTMKPDTKNEILPEPSMEALKRADVATKAVEETCISELASVDC